MTGHPGGTSSAPAGRPGVTSGMTARVLAGDIGGTSTRFALYEREPTGALRLREELTVPSREHGSLESALEAFPAARWPLDAAGFGVAGPVHRGRSRLTNLTWDLDEAALARRLGAPVRLLNDLQAAAWGMLDLPEASVAWIHEGRPEEEGGGGAGRQDADRAGDAARRDTLAVIAPGTGLGEGALVWDGARYHAVPTEGGHADFTARTDLEIDLLRWLQGRLGGRVSVERVLSGPGIVAIYEFLREQGVAKESAEMARAMTAGDPPAAISRAALGDADPLSRAALDVFASALGGQAGDLALRFVARGGVFVAGGIAPKILAALQAGSFVRSYRDKGRFSAFVSDIPVRVCLDPRAGLAGAARAALEAPPPA